MACSAKAFHQSLVSSAKRNEYKCRETKSGAATVHRSEHMVLFSSVEMKFYQKHRRRRVHTCERGRGNQLQTKQTSTPEEPTQHHQSFKKKQKKTLLYFRERKKQKNNRRRGNKQRNITSPTAAAPGEGLTSKNNKRLVPRDGSGSVDHYPACP